MRAVDKWLDRLSWAGILTLVATMGLGLLVPIYVDEVATKIVQARFLAEGGQTLSLFPQCAAGFLLPTPLTWYPAAAVVAVLYGHLQPLGLRLAGIGVFLGWLAACAGWLLLTIPDPRRRLRSGAVVAAILALGVLPLTLILSRPEQWLVLLLTCYLLLAAGAERILSRGRFWPPAVLIAAFLLLTSLLNFAHPKALFFLPLVVVAAACTFGMRRKWLLALALTFAGFSAYQTYGFAKAAARCEESPILSGILAAQTTSMSLALREPVSFLSEVTTSLVTAPGKIAAHGVFQGQYQSSWLPPVPFAAAGSFVKMLNLGIRAVWYLTCLLALLLPPVVFILSPGNDGRLAHRLLMPALWLGLVGHLALYKEWNFYGGSLVVALAALLLVHSHERMRRPTRLTGLANGVLAFVLILSLASAAVLARQMAPPLLRAARSTDEVPANQQYSVNAFAFNTARDRIRGLADSCGIAGDGAMRLVVDDLTYFAFTGLHQPIHLGFLWPGGWGADIAGRTRSLLVDMQSDGMIARCDLFGPEFRYQTLREGNLCCVALMDRSYY